MASPHCKAVHVWRKIHFGCKCLCDCSTFLGHKTLRFLESREPGTEGQVPQTAGGPVSPPAVPHLPRGLQCWQPPTLTAEGIPGFSRDHLNCLESCPLTCLGWLRPERKGREININLFDRRQNFYLSTGSFLRKESAVSLGLSMPLLVLVMLAAVRMTPVVRRVGSDRAWAQQPRHSSSG